MATLSPTKTREWDVFGAGQLRTYAHFGERVDLQSRTVTLGSGNVFSLTLAGEDYYEPRLPGEQAAGSHPAQEKAPGGREPTRGRHPGLLAQSPYP